MRAIPAAEHVLIHRPREEVFAYFADLRHEHPHPGLAAGLLRVTEAEAPYHVRIEGRVGRAPYWIATELDPAGDGTRVSEVVSWSPQGGWRLLAPFLRPALRRETQRALVAAKARLESMGTS